MPKCRWAKWTQRGAGPGPQSARVTRASEESRTRQERSPSASDHVDLRGPRRGHRMRHRTPPSMAPAPESICFPDRIGHPVPTGSEIHLVLDNEATRQTRLFGSTSVRVDVSTSHPPSVPRSTRRNVGPERSPGSGSDAMCPKASTSSSPRSTDPSGRTTKIQSPSPGHPPPNASSSRSPHLVLEPVDHPTRRSPTGSAGQNEASRVTEEPAGPSDWTPRRDGGRP